MLYFNCLKQANGGENVAIAKVREKYFDYFNISSQTEADKFVLDFGKSKLGRELIELYNKSVENVNHLKEIESSPYFTQRLNEAQLEEERKIAAKKEREKWQGVISEKDAIIAELKKRLGED